MGELSGQFPAVWELIGPSAQNAEWVVRGSPGVPKGLEKEGASIATPTIAIRVSHEQVGTRESAHGISPEEITAREIHRSLTLRSRQLYAGRSGGRPEKV